MACKTQPTFSKAEVSEQSLRLATLLADQSSPDCQRPLLRRQDLVAPVVVSDTRGALALVDPAGPHGDCLAKLTSKPPPPQIAALIADYRDDGVLNSPKNVKPRRKPVKLEELSLGEAIHKSLYDYHRDRGRPYYVRPLLVPEPQTQASLRVHCSGISSSVRKVVARNSSCSPASVGGPTSIGPQSLGGLPAGLELVSFAENVSTLGAVLTVESQALVREGHPLEAAQLLLDGMRLGDDLARGRVPIMVELVAQGMAKTLFGQLAHLVLEADVLDAAQRQTVYEELQILIETQPSPSDHFAGEELFLLEQNLSAVKRASKQTNVKEALLAALSLEFLASERYKVCPRGSSHLACIEGWESLRKRIVSGEEKLPFVATKSNSADKIARALLVELTDRGEYLRKASMAGGRLAALELAMRSMQDVPCPAKAQAGSNIEVVVDAGADEFGVLIFMAKELQRQDTHRDYNLLLRFECPVSVAEKSPSSENAPLIEHQSSNEDQ